MIRLPDSPLTLSNTGMNAISLACDQAAMLLARAKDGS
jgi:hypothetical protein